mgnify:CR=1 FL=1
MQSKNKDSVTIKNEASELRDAARAQLDEHITNLKQNLDAGHHGALEGEVREVLNQHKEGASLKGPDGLAAQAKKNTQHFSKMGNQKNILRYLKLAAAHDKLAERLQKNAADASIAMAAKRVHDLLGR